LRIAVVASPVTPLLAAQLGGAQAFVADLASGLARRGHEVALYCAEGSDVEGVQLVTVPAPPDAAAALVMPGGRPPAPAPGVALALAEMFAAIRASRPDAVSQHAFDAPAFELSKGMPVLHTLHLPPLVQGVTNAVAQTPASSLATVSLACRASWSRAGIEVGRILRNGVPEVSVETGSVAEGALVAGRLSPEKGIEHAIAAAGAARLAVTVAGADYDPEYMVSLSGARRVGAIPRPELLSLMARSAVTVCAVRWEEPFGMVAAEAQMAGCPVAAYGRGALPEVVESGVSGYLATPDDVEDLARAIRRCLALDRAAVKESARRRLSLGAALDRYEAALREVAS
jgi:hypothetical protein